MQITQVEYNLLNESIISEITPDLGNPENYIDFTIEDYNFSLTSNLFIGNDSTNIVYDENQINEKRKENLHNKLTPVLISLLQYEDVEYGIRTESEKIIREQLEINTAVTLLWLNDIYVTYFSNEKIISGLLRIVGNIEEELICSFGHVIALASLNHKNDEIKELSIRAFENWGSTKSYRVLSVVKVGTKWLQDYIDQVVKDLQIELCLSL